MLGKSNADDRVSDYYRGIASAQEHLAMTGLKSLRAKRGNPPPSLATARFPPTPPEHLARA